MLVSPPACPPTLVSSRFVSSVSLSSAYARSLRRSRFLSPSVVCSPSAVSRPVSSRLVSSRLLLRPRLLSCVAGAALAQVSLLSRPDEETMARYRAFDLPTIVVFSVAPTRENEEARTKGGEQQ